LSWTTAVALGAILASPVMASGETVPDITLSITDHQSYYEVFAQRPSELAERLRVGPAVDNERPHAGGLTRVSMRVTPELRLRDGRCRLRSAKIDLDVEIILPRWRGDAPLPDRLRSVWERAKKMIAAHEAKHRENAVRAAEAVSSALREMPSEESCLSLERSLSRLFAREDRRRGLRDAALDRHQMEFRTFNDRVDIRRRRMVH